MRLSRKSAIALAFAFTAHKTAAEKLESGTMESYVAWLEMRDEKLRQIFGMSYSEIHAFAHGKPAR